MKRFLKKAMIAAMAVAMLFAMPVLGVQANYTPVTEMEEVEVVPLQMLRVLNNNTQFFRSDGVVQGHIHAGTIVEALSSGARVRVRVIGGTPAQHNGWIGFVGYVNASNLGF